MNRFASDVIKDDKVKVRDTDVEAKLDALITAVESSGGGGDLSNVIDDDKLKVKDSDVKQELQFSNILTKLKPCFQRGLGNCWNLHDRSSLSSNRPAVVYYIYNPPNSGKQIYIYNIVISSADDADDATNVRFGVGAAGDFNPDISIEISNLNTNVANKENQNYGKRNSTLGQLFSNQTAMSYYRMRGNTDTVILDYQEEHIQLGEGTGFYVIFERFLNKNPFIATQIRFMEIPNNEIPTEWVV